MWVITVKERTGQGRVWTENVSTERELAERVEQLYAMYREVEITTEEKHEVQR